MAVQELTGDAAVLLKVKCISERIEAIPHLKRVGPWHAVVNYLITLVETDNNLSALWVWNRFCWTFGKRDVWQANDMLDNIFNWYVIPCTQANRAYEAMPRWRFIRRHRLHQAMVDHAFNLMLAMHELWQTERQWNDRDAFMGYAGQGLPSSANTKTSLPAAKS